MSEGSSGASGRVRRRLVKLGVFLGVQGLIIFALLEVAGRIVDPLGISFYPESARLFDTFIVEEPIGYRHRPGLAGEFLGVPVRINSLGMRDREVPPKAAGEFRVLLLGDSVPFGMGVTYEQSIPARLAALLNESSQGTHYRTLNMGVPSYNTEQELIQLRSVGLGLEPDLVLLLFTLNDIEPKMWVLEKRSSPLVNLGQRSYAVTLLASLAKRVRRVVAPLDGGIFSGRYSLDHPRWQAIDDSLTEIRRLCERAGIPFVVFTRITEDEHPAFDMLAEVGRREGFAVLSMSPWADPRWAGAERREYENSSSDSHPNPAGCVQFATMLHEGLEGVGVLPRMAEDPAPAP